MIDSCILNEIYRNEKKRLGYPLLMEFRSESFDSDLLTTFLMENIYELGFGVRLLPFMRNEKLFPEKYRKTLKKTWGLGIWLDLYNS